jgi:hypothetical protein
MTRGGDVSSFIEPCRTFSRAPQIMNGCDCGGTAALGDRETAQMQSLASIEVIVRDRVLFGERHSNNNNLYVVISLPHSLDLNYAGKRCNNKYSQPSQNCTPANRNPSLVAARQQQAKDAFAPISALLNCTQNRLTDGVQLASADCTFIFNVAGPPAGPIIYSHLVMI